jgi:tetratricopeptide (TPR) repeat protein
VGKYTLTVKEVAQVGPAQTLKGDLKKTDPVTAKGRFVKVHKIDLDAGRPYVFELDSPHFDPNLLLVDPTGQKRLTQNNHAGEFVTSSRIDFTPREAGTYQLRVTSIKPGDTGPYTLRIQGYESRELKARDQAAVQRKLGVALAKKGQLDEAMAAFREAIRLNKDDSAARGNLGLALLEKGRIDEAIAELRVAIRLSQDYPDAHNTLGLALERKGRLDEAIAEYREAIRLKPDYANAHNNVGGALRLKGQVDEAIAEFRQAIRISPKRAECHSNLGVALADRGQLDEAIAEFREAIRLKHDLAQAHSHLGMALTSRGRLAEAVAALKEAVRLAPKNAEVLNALAWFLATCPDGKFRDPAQAVELARKAVKLQASSAAAWNTLGVAHYRAGSWKASIEALQKSMDLNKGGDANDWFFLAMAHSRLDNKKEAREWYDRAAAWQQEKQPRNEELRRFRAEAAALVGVKE